MSSIGVLYAISEVAGSNCFNLVQSSVPTDITVIHFPDAQAEAFKKASAIEDREERINYIAMTLYTGVKYLAENGAKIIIIAANSVHIAFDKLTEMAKNTFPDIELLSIIDSVAEHSKRYNCISIVGSNSTIQSRMYHQKIETDGTSIYSFSSKEQKFIHDLITAGYTKLTIPSEIKEEFKKICINAKENGVEAIVLACTELSSLLIETDYAGIKCIDSNKILADYAVNVASKINPQNTIRLSSI